MQYKFKIGILSLTLFIFFSCSSSGNGVSDNYENVVMGIWDNYHKNTDSLVMTRVFTSDYQSYFTFAEGKKHDALNKSKYFLDETHIYLQNYTQTYKIEDDTLWITNSKGDQITKYIRLRK